MFYQASTFLLLTELARSGDVSARLAAQKQA
jgi:hypothetical protein